MKLEGRSALIRLLCLAMIFCLLIVTALAEPVDSTRDVPADSARDVVRQIELSTTYPAIVAKAGDSLTFPLDLDNRSGESQDIVRALAASNFELHHLRKRDVDLDEIYSRYFEKEGEDRASGKSGERFRIGKRVR